MKHEFLHKWETALYLYHVLIEMKERLENVIRSNFHFMT